MKINQLKGIVLGLIATTFWASFYPVGRVLFGREAEKFDELFVSFLRFGFAFLFLLPFACSGGNLKKIRNEWKNDWKSWVGLATVGIVGEGIMVFVATKYTTAARASLLANASPIFTVLLSYLFVREALTMRKITGMTIGLAGILLIVTSQGADLFSHTMSTLPGDLMALGSGVCWSAYTVFGERVANKYGGMLSTTILFFLGMVIMVPVMMVFQSRVTFDFPLTVWCGIVYLGCCNGLANGLWYKALKYLKPGELGSFGYISAIMTIGLSVIFLHETITWQFIVAVLLVLGGVALMLAQGRKIKAAQNDHPFRKQNNYTR